MLSELVNQLHCFKKSNKISLYYIIVLRYSITTNVIKIEQNGTQAGEQKPQPKQKNGKTDSVSPPPPTKRTPQPLYNTIVGVHNINRIS